eukprot:gene44804-55755_t
MALFLLARVYLGECRSLNQIDMYTCNSELSSRALPQEFMIIMMTNPLLYTIVMKSIRFEDVILSWIFMLTTLFVAIGIS